MVATVECGEKGRLCNLGFPSTQTHTVTKTTLQQCILPIKWINAVINVLIDCDCKTLLDNSAHNQSLNYIIFRTDWLTDWHTQRHRKWARIPSNVPGWPTMEQRRQLEVAAQSELRELSRVALPAESRYGIKLYIDMSSDFWYYPFHTQICITFPTEYVKTQLQLDEKGKADTDWVGFLTFDLVLP